MVVWFNWGLIMHSVKRALKFLHGLSLLTIAFMPFFIVIFIFLAIFQLKVDIQRDIEDIERVYKNDRIILQDNLLEVKNKLASLKTVKSIKAIENQFAIIYGTIKDEVDKDKKIVDEVLLVEWERIKSDTKVIKQSIDNVKTETDKLMAVVKSIPLTIDLPFDIHLEIPGMKELIQLVTNNVLSQVLISIGASFESIEKFKVQLGTMLSDGIQAIEVKEIERITAQITQLSDDIRDDIVIVRQSITTMQSMLIELATETKEAIHPPVSMSFIIYGLLVFSLSLFYFLYLTIRYRFLEPFFNAIDLIKHSFKSLSELKADELKDTG